MLNDKNLIDKIEKADIISFDVFDTLLYRLVDRPEAVFEILESTISLEDFSKKRQKIQNIISEKVYKKYGYSHANIDEIYDEFDAYEVCRFSSDEIKQKEINLEKELLYANPEMKEVYNYVKKKNKKIIITTDMYLDSKFIDEVLKKNGYTGYKKIYDSADCRVAKFDGKLYDLVISKENIDPSKILHIGDNKKDDVENAEKHGLITYRYKSSYVIDNKSKIGDFISSLNNGLKRKNVLYKIVDMNFWEKFGYYVGGPVYGSLEKFFNKQIKNYKGNVFFVARDGYNLSKIYDNKNYKYLYMSRRALLLASIKKIDDDSLNNLPPFTFGQTVKEILSYIRFDSLTKDDINMVGFNSFDQKINSIDDMNKFKMLYVKFEKKFLKVCEEERKNALSYFKNIGLLDNDAIIFDAGWHASSQYLLEKFLYNNDYKFNIKFCYAGIDDNEKSRKQLKDKKYSSLFFNIGYRPPIINDIMDSVVLFELLFGAPENSVWYYDKKGYVLENLENDFKYKQDILVGIKKYLSDTKVIYDNYIDLIVGEKYLVPLHELIVNPTMEEAKTIGNVKNVDGFANKNGETKYIAYITKDMLKKNINTEVYWKNGLYKRDDVENDVKKIIKNRNVSFVRRVKDKFNSTKLSFLIYKTRKYMYDHGMSVFVYNKKRQLYSKLYYHCDDYHKWIKNNESNLEYFDLDYQPLISVVIPVYNVKENELVDCINSVLNQTYKNFELIMVDDCSTKYNVHDVLQKYENNSKIKIDYHKKNQHISQTTNDAIKLASGEFIAFMDCDDIISPNALFEVARMLNNNKKLDFIYSDEDKINEDGSNRHSPFFKPDWSPDTFLSLMYTSHLGVYRKKIVDEIGGLTVGLDGAQDYDFTLRFVEKTQNIGHISKILYHWRERQESIASNPEAKPYALNAIEKLKQDYLNRNNLKGKVEYDNRVYQYRIVYDDINESLVSIIILSKDNPDVLENCLSSIKNKTEYKNYELIVVDNGSSKYNKVKYEELSKKYCYKYIYIKEEFNFSRMCNIGSNNSSGDYYLFLNDDTEVLTSSWLNRLLGQASQKHAGAVGAKLYYPYSTRIQHDGIINLKNGPSHLLQNYDDFNNYYYCNNRMDYNYIAVTGACLMISKKKFDEVNGFDESYPVAYNDVDLCLKLVEHGYYNVVRNDVILYHFESYTRGSDFMSAEKMDRLRKELKKLYSNHQIFLGNDPFYSKNLDQNSINFQLNIDDEKENVINEFNGDIAVTNDSNVCFAIQNCSSMNNRLIISGYQFIKNINHNNDSNVSLILRGVNKNYIISTTKLVNYSFSNIYKIHCDLCDFKSVVSTNNIDSGKYDIILLIKNSRDKVSYYVETTNVIEI